MVRWQISAILGLAAAAAVTAASVLTRTSDIALDLGTRAGQVLAGEATSWAAVDVRGRDLYLRGDAPSEDLRQLAIERLGRIHGVRRVEAAAAGLLPEISPYATVIERTADTVTLSGALPSLPDRARLLGSLAAATPGLSIADHGVLARGKPDERYLDVLKTLVGLPPLLADGRIELSERMIRISGEAASNSAYDRLTAFAPSLPEGYSVELIDVQRPLASPFAWSVDRDDSGATLSGYVPDPATRDLLLGAVRDAVGPRNVFDNLDYASGAPDRFADIASDAADYLDLLATAHVGINDRQVVVSGRAASPEAYRTLNAYLETWNPPGYVVQRSIALPVVDPFTLTVSKSGGRVTVTGFVPSDAARAEIAAAAKGVAGDDEPVVETTLSDGEPDGFVDAARFAVSLLANLDVGTALLSSNHISLAGVAATPGDLIELAAAAAAPPAGFDVALGVTPPEVSPYVWSAAKDAEQLTVSGSAPSEAARSAIRAVLESSSKTLAVVDRSGLGAGLAPEIDLVAVARKAAAILGELDAGEVRLDDGVLSVSGKVANAAARDAVIDEVGALPAGVGKGKVILGEPAAFRFFIERGLDTVTLDGDLNSEAMRATLVAAAGRSLGKTDLLDSTAVAASAPETAEAAALFAVRAASLLAKGNVSINGQDVTVTGNAFTAVGAARVAGELSAHAPAGFRLDIRVTAPVEEAPLEPTACAEALSEVLTRNPLRFDSGAAAISADSRGLVDRLGGLALRCPAARLGIVATAEGSDAQAAAALAESRARAVAAAFADVGVDPARLDARGDSGEADALTISLSGP